VSTLLCMFVCMNGVIVFSCKVSRLGVSLIYEDGSIIHLSPGDECIILC
jgi:hypothetical protein